MRTPLRSRTQVRREESSHTHLGVGEGGDDDGGRRGSPRTGSPQDGGSRGYESQETVKPSSDERSLSPLPARNSYPGDRPAAPGRSFVERDGCESDGWVLTTTTTPPARPRPGPWSTVLHRSWFWGRLAPGDGDLERTLDERRKRMPRKGGVEDRQNGPKVTRGRGSVSQCSMYTDLGSVPLHVHGQRGTGRTLVLLPTCTSDLRLTVGREYDVRRSRV